MRMRRCVSLALAAVLLSAAAPAGEVISLEIDPQAILEVIPLAAEAIAIQQRANVREAKHAAELRKKGIAEVPPCGSEKYVIDAPAIGGFSLNDWGELYIDRRFVTDEEMKTVKKIEAWVAKWLLKDAAPPAGGKGGGKKSVKRREKTSVAGLPVFRGFEDARYQAHDALIRKLVAEFNANKKEWTGGTDDQAAKVADITPALVKSHMIEESGGNGPRSKAAWAVDPLQVNVPGDWGVEKELVGLTKPSKRNEGTAEQNVRAAIKYLSRKGFGASARPAATRPKGFFDGWPRALQRYNGRRDRTDTDRYYSDEYADKIVRRAKDPNSFVPIEIKLAK